jgi:hypothetical protein
VHGYEVVTSDEHKAGHVVGEVGDNLIVEHGTIFKSKHAVPRMFAVVEDDERVVRLTISKAILEGSPKLEDDEIDEHAIASHYGLAGGEDAPPTEGYGDLLPTDPARTADEDARNAGLEAADEARARIHEHQEPGEGRLDRPESPGLTGGDRFRDTGH